MGGIHNQNMVKTDIIAASDFNFGLKVSFSKLFHLQLKRSIKKLHCAAPSAERSA
jgi:hypothetical protein